MRRTACALAVAAVISASAIGSSNAVPAAPLPAEVQTQTSDIAQVRWHPRWRAWHRWHHWHHYWGYRYWYWHHAWYPHRYYYYGWYPAPAYYWGWGWRYWW